MSDLNLYTDKDLVDVVDADGNAIEGMPKAPRAWLKSGGKHLVPPGTKEGKPKTDDSSDSSSTPTPAKPGREPGTEPAKNGSLADWTAYATEKGATDQDLLDDTGAPLTRDALIEKYGTKAS